MYQGAVTANTPSYPSGSLSGAPTPTPLRPIQESMLRQEKAAQALHEAIGELESRLASVTPPQSLTAAPVTSAENGQITSMHHQRLIELAMSIEAARGRIVQLLDHLQL